MCSCKESMWRHTVRCAPRGSCHINRWLPQTCMRVCNSCRCNPNLSHRPTLKTKQSSSPAKEIRQAHKHYCTLFYRHCSCAITSNLVQKDNSRKKSFTGAFWGIQGMKTEGTMPSFSQSMSGQTINALGSLTSRTLQATVP